MPNIQYLKLYPVGLFQLCAAMAAGLASVLDLASVDVRMARIVHHAAGFRFKVCQTRSARRREGWYVDAIIMVSLE